MLLAWIEVEHRWWGGGGDPSGNGKLCIRALDYKIFVLGVAMLSHMHINVCVCMHDAAGAGAGGAVSCEYWCRCMGSMWNRTVAIIEWVSFVPPTTQPKHSK